MAVGDSGSAVTLWDLRSHAAMGTPFLDSRQSGGVLHLALSPDGQYVVEDPLGGHGVLWDVASHQVVQTIQQVNAMVFSPDGALVAIALHGASPNPVHFYSLRAKRYLQSLTGSAAEVEDVAFSPDGRTLAAIDRGGTVTLWDRQSGQPGAHFPAGATA